MRGQRGFLCNFAVAPSQERGLKFWAYVLHIPVCIVAPSQERGLKLNAIIAGIVSDWSLLRRSVD